MDDTRKVSDDFVRLARLALSGRNQDIHLFLHRAAKRYRSEMPELGQSIAVLLRESPTRASPLRRDADQPLPVDLDSRLQLLRVEQIQSNELDPVLSPKIRPALEQLIAERLSPDKLLSAHLHPTRTALFTGPPGVGKTLAAHWLAQRIHKPLLVLDLAAVMSSFLGRTGNNVRHVLDYAKSIDCVLLLDELDSLAKRRDDNSEIGELKRLVTVLLQEIDDWPSSGLLLAATNHPDLLDPAVWRRFELIVEFPMPNEGEIEQYISRILDREIASSKAWVEILSSIFVGKSFSEIERSIGHARRAAAVQEKPLDTFLTAIAQENASTMDKSERITLASRLVSLGIISQRQARDLTGISRDTIRKSMRRTGRR